MLVEVPISVLPEPDDIELVPPTAQPGVGKCTHVAMPFFSWQMSNVHPLLS